MELQRTHKGFLFTLDAVFALIVASLGISILLYVHYTNNAQFIQTSLEAESILNNLVQTSVGYAGGGSQMASYIANSGNSAGATWQQFAHDQGLSSSTGFAAPPYLLYNYTTSNTIAPPAVVVGDGMVAFTEGSSVYAINATTGNTLANFPVALSGAPGSAIIYNNRIITSTWTSGCTPCTLTEIDKTGNVIWSNSVGYAVSSYSSLQIEGGYIAFSCSGVNLCVANLVNGTLVGIVSDTPLPVQPPAYANGEFIVSTSATAAQNYLQGYTVTNAGIVKVWQTALSSSATTNPVVNGNEIAVGSGSALYITTLGGVVTNTIALSGSVKGISSANNNIYVQTSAGLYGFNPNGVQIFSHTTPTQNFNFTPSIAGSTLYTLINGRVFEGFNVNNGQQLWNMSLPNAPYAPSGTQFYNNIALAYGNAYVADGSELYAFGTYKAKPGDSLLQSLAAMYLNNQGAYASILLSKIYPSQNVGLYINSTYAPDLQVATFNAISGCASLAYLSTNTTAALQQGKNISVSAWMYPTDLTTSRGVVSGDSYFIRVDSPGEGGKISWFVYVNSAIEPRLSSKAAPQTNRWYHVVGTYNQKSGVMNLYVNGALNNTETRTGAPTTGYFGAGYKFTVGTASSCQFIGKIADVQVYDNALSSGQVQQLYSEGLFGAPLSGSGLALWWPLDGNGNDYGGNFYNGFPNNVLWQNATYLPGSLLNSYQVSKASTPVALPSNGINNFYNVSVVVWK